MSEIKIINGQSLPNIPWQERPADLEEGAVLWRYTENPVMGRNPTPKIGRIFNSAVVPWQDGYIAVLRGEQVNGVPHVYLGRSKDGIHWNVDRERVQFVDENGEPWMPNYAYDPRLVKVEDTYYIIWCTDFHGAAIGMAKTKDFKTFTRIENPVGLRAYAVRGHLPLRKPRPDLLGTPPACDEPRPDVVGSSENRRGRVSD